VSSGLGLSPSKADRVRLAASSHSRASLVVRFDADPRRVGVMAEAMAEAMADYDVRGSPHRIHALPARFPLPGDQLGH